MENKIILIEDDEEIREMINDYLSGEFEVTWKNYKECLKIECSGIYFLCVCILCFIAPKLRKITGHDKIPVCRTV